jgi:methionyl-tRNA formyltransferase
MPGIKLFLLGYGKPAHDVLRYILSQDDISDLAIFTHPDREYDYGLSAIAKAHGLLCSEESVNEMAVWPFQPDIIASVYYRTIVKQPVIDACQGRIFNAHTSLLPLNRGRSPVPWSILSGASHTGVTFHYINAGVDIGLILFQVAIQIAPDETQASLFGKINQTVVDYWPRALELVKLNTPGLPQRGESSHHMEGCPFGGEINPSWSEAEIERFIRAMTYPPRPYAKFGGQEIRTMEDWRAIRG